MVLVTGTQPLWTRAYTRRNIVAKYCCHVHVHCVREMHFKSKQCAWMSYLTPSHTLGRYCHISHSHLTFISRYNFIYTIESTKHVWLNFRFVCCDFVFRIICIMIRRVVRRRFDNKSKKANCIHSSHFHSRRQWVIILCNNVDQMFEIQFGHFLLLLLLLVLFRSILIDTVIQYEQWQ